MYSWPHHSNNYIIYSSILKSSIGLSNHSASTDSGANRSLFKQCRTTLSLSRFFESLQVMRQWLDPLENQHLFQGYLEISVLAPIWILRISVQVWKQQSAASVRRLKLYLMLKLFRWLWGERTCYFQMCEVPASVSFISVFQYYVHNIVKRVCVKTDEYNHMDFVN